MLKIWSERGYNKAHPGERKCFAMNKRMDIRRLCLLGVLTALVFAGNFARIVMPIAVGGTTAFTLGNIMCVLSGLLMGPVGCLASGIGAALYDLTNPLYISEVPFTFLNKLVMGLVAGLIAHWGKTEGKYGRCLIAAAAGCVAYYVLYFLKSYYYNALFLQGLPSQTAWVALLDKIPASIFNGVLAVVVAPPLCLAIRAALRRAHLKLA